MFGSLKGHKDSAMTRTIYEQQAQWERADHQFQAVKHYVRGSGTGYTPDAQWDHPAQKYCGAGGRGR